MRDDAKRAGKDRCMEEWKGDIVGHGLVGKKGGRTNEDVVRAKVCHIHKPLSTPAADHSISDPGAKDLSVALAKCPNLHTLDLSGQWITVRCDWRWDLVEECARMKKAEGTGKRRETGRRQRENE